VTDPIDERVLATLEQILAVQRELLAQLRQAGSDAAAVTAESLALQRTAAERSTAAFETQKRMSRLYRGVVTVGGLLVLGGIGTIVYVFVSGG
jgi:hypothetical protein